MLFKLINCYPEQYEDDIDKQLALSNIIKSHGLRKHLVISDKCVIDSILINDWYGGLEKTFAQDIAESRKEYYQLISELNFYVEIDFEVGGIDCTQLHNQTKVRIGHSFFKDTQNVEALSLISEGSDDFLYYKVIADYYSKNVSPLNLNLKFTECLGSGSKSKSEFERLSQKNKLLLCIVDNDKKHPKKGEGSTSIKFTKENRSLDSIPLALVLGVREIESLIPIKTIEKILIKNAVNAIDTLDEIKEFNTINPEFRVYFDHKMGLTLKEAIDLDSKYGDFWLNIMSKTERFNEKECFRSKICTNCGDCPKIKGFGESLLSNTVEFISQQNLRNLKHDIDEYLSPHWYQIGHLLMSWGCAGTGRVVRS
jgi:hypothetical protein